jgi:hypothetical protein
LVQRAWGEKDPTVTLNRASLIACGLVFVLLPSASAESGSDKSIGKKGRWGKAQFPYRAYPTAPLLRDLPDGEVVQSQVSRVHVFDGGARVERTAKVVLEAGDHRLVFPALPANIQASTLTLSGFGTTASAGSTFLESGTLVESRPDSLVELEAELGRLRDELSALADRQEVLGARRDLMMQTVGTSTNEPVAAVRARLDYAEQELTKTGRELTQNAEKQAVLAPQLAAIEKAYTDLRKSLERPVKHVVVEVTASQKVELPLTMRYLVTGPTWRPRHVARYDPAGGKLQLDTYAWIVQETPEPWDDVELIISTARPVFGLSPPSAPSQWVDAVKDKDLVAGEAHALREVASGGNRLAEVERRTFRPADRVLVPSGKKGKRVLIHTVSLDAPEAAFHAVPARAGAVYLSLTLVNPEREAWLPGEASLFNGSDYVGTAKLPVVRAGEEINLPYGADPALRVERRRAGAERTEDRSRKTVVAEWEYHLYSALPRAVIVTVKESLPVARNNQVRVQIESEGLLPGPTGSPKGTGQWRVQLPANGKKTWRLRAEVSANARARIVGMQ